MCNIDRLRRSLSQDLRGDISHPRWRWPPDLQTPLRQLLHADVVDIKQLSIPGDAQDRGGVLGWKLRQPLDFFLRPLALGDVLYQGLKNILASDIHNADGYTGIEFGPVFPFEQGRVINHAPGC